MKQELVLLVKMPNKIEYLYKKIKLSSYHCLASHHEYCLNWSLLTTACPTMSGVACEIERAEDEMIRFRLYFVALDCL